jgi:hypothetical protein
MGDLVDYFMERRGDCPANRKYEAPPPEDRLGIVDIYPSGKKKPRYGEDVGRLGMLLDGVELGIRCIYSVASGIHEIIRDYVKNKE